MINQYSIPNENYHPGDSWNKVFLGKKELNNNSIQKLEINIYDYFYPYINKEFTTSKEFKNLRSQIELDLKTKDIIEINNIFFDKSQAEKILKFLNSVIDVFSYNYSNTCAKNKAMYK